MPVYQRDLPSGERAAPRPRTGATSLPGPALLRFGDRPVAGAELRLEHGGEAMLDGAPDIVMGLDIGPKIFRGRAPEAGRRVEDHGRARSLAGEHGKLADQVAGAAGADLAAHR